jgi:hypothetical protein
MAATRSSSPWARLAVVAVFAAAFALIEASVVFYLRRLFTLQFAAVYTAQKFAFPHAYLRHEQVREGATIVVLLAVGYLAGRGVWQKIAYFLFAFGVWDLGYYVALKIMLGWPPSLGTRDLLFLSPREWWAPVWEPVLASCVIIAVAVLILRWTRRE